MNDVLRIDETCSLQSHGRRFFLRLSAQLPTSAASCDGHLSLNLTTANYPSHNYPSHNHYSASWSATFDAPYIDAMTRKTGNFKRFIVFLEMLVAGMKRRDQSVPLDVMTYDDIQSMAKLPTKENALDQRRKKSIHGKSTKNQKRRYLVLSYAAAYDRVHYPLPLDEDASDENQPDNAVLDMTDVRLNYI